MWFVAVVIKSRVNQSTDSLTKSIFQIAISRLMMSIKTTKQSINNLRRYS